MNSKKDQNPFKSAYNKLRFECFRHKIINILLRPLCLFNEHHYIATNIKYDCRDYLFCFEYVEYTCKKCHKKKYLVYNNDTNKFETAYKLKEEKKDGES